MGTPITYEWTGEEMRPLRRFHNLVNDQFVVGQKYTLAEVEERSTASHGHFFATVHDCWQSLPDHLALQFPTPDILRKHALIMTGFRRERKFVASSPAEARKLAAFLRPQSVDDDYAIISVHGSVVVEWRALSQSYRAMPEKGQFHRSKTAVLEWLADVLAVPDAALSPGRDAA